MIGAVRRLSSMVAVISLLATGACRDPDSHGGVTIDTLPNGTVVVRNGARGMWGQAPWQLEEGARIGQVDGDDPYVFGQIRDVRLGPDNLVYALDRQASEVRVFTLGGSHVRTIGRPGRGPGEFVGPYALAFDATGQLWVADESAVRYTILRSTGEVVRTIPRANRYFGQSGTLEFSPDGTSLWEVGFLGGGMRGAIRFDVDSLVTPVDTTVFPRFEAQVFLKRGSAEGLGKPIPNAPQLVTAVGRDGTVWLGSGSSYELYQIAPTGDTLRIVSRAAEPVALSAADVKTIATELDEARAQDFEVDESRVPSTYPFFTAIVLGDDGYVWVRRVAAGHVPVFDLFDPQGTYLGELPASVTDYPEPHISTDYLVGVSQDSLDIQSVRVYRIRK